MRTVVCFVAVFLSAAAVFAADINLSAGAGGILGGAFTRYNISADGTSRGGQRIEAEQLANQFDYGFLAFFDATYGTFSILLQNGVGSFDQPVKNQPGMSSNGQSWETVLSFSLLGKYPFSLNEKLTVYPMLGMDYKVSLVQRRRFTSATPYGDAVIDPTVMPDPSTSLTSSQADFNSFHVRLGGGAEYLLTDRIFVRGDVLFGIRLMTDYERKNLDYMKKMTYDNSPKLGGLSFGPSVRLAAGYRFHSF